MSPLVSVLLIVLPSMRMLVHVKTISRWRLKIDRAGADILQVTASDNVVYARCGARFSIDIHGLNVGV